MTVPLSLQILHVTKHLDLVIRFAHLHQTAILLILSAVMENAQDALLTMTAQPIFQTIQCATLLLEPVVFLAFQTRNVRMKSLSAQTLYVTPVDMTMIV
jgi:hypothetical protein